MALLNVIEWVEQSPDEIIHKFDTRKNIVKRGSKLTVREGQTVVFCDNGTMADVFKPGMYKLDTDTLPILTALLSWAYAFESPFKSDIYFVSTRQFVNHKWGTATPVIINDSSLGAVRVRGIGRPSLVQNIRRRRLHPLNARHGHIRRSRQLRHRRCRYVGKPYRTFGFSVKVARAPLQGAGNGAVDL